MLLGGVAFPQQFLTLLSWLKHSGDRQAAIFSVPSQPISQTAANQNRAEPPANRRHEKGRSDKAAA
jgi:hypothetical protein